MVQSSNMRFVWLQAVSHHLQLELERMQWRHQQELQEMKHNFGKGNIRSNDFVNSRSMKYSSVDDLE